MNRLTEETNDVKLLVDNILSVIRSKIEVNFSDGDIDTKTLPQIITTVRTLFEELREFIHNYTFNSQEEEIWFFKEGKPAVMSKLIYYNELYRIELGRPNGGKSVAEDYYKQKLQHISKFFNDHLDFYRYYRSKERYLDKYYFLRGYENINLNHNYGMFDKDPLFCSCCDYWVAKILTNDLLDIYLEQKIKDIDKNDKLIGG